MLWVFISSKDDNEGPADSKGEGESASESDVIDANSIYKGWSKLQPGSKLER